MFPLYYMHSNIFSRFFKHTITLVTRGLKIQPYHVTLNKVLTTEERKEKIRHTPPPFYRHPPPSYLSNERSLVRRWRGVYRTEKIRGYRWACNLHNLTVSIPCPRVVVNTFSTWRCLKDSGVMLTNFWTILSDGYHNSI